jgi:hypothetical protein
MLRQRIGEKFGTDVLETVLAVASRRVDDDGVELSGDERRDDYVERLAAASESARWVCAADKLHNARTLVADLRRTIDPGTIWRRFSVGKDGTLQWYRRVYDRLAEVGFAGAIMAELEAAVASLEEWGSAAA